MNLKNALKSIIRPHENDRLTPLTTVWGEALDHNNVLPEYPRPQLRRDSFLSLNGYWDYAITQEATPPLEFDGKILVPFSPESTLSGVNRQLLPGEYLWYQRTLPALPCPVSSGMRTVLHFGAVDYQAQVSVNGHPVIFHQGGYLPFHADITDYLKEGDNRLLLKVQDPTDQGGQPRGKQSLHRGGIFYTAQSGIWQSVWLEQVPASHIEELWFETNYDERRVTAHIKAVAGAKIPSLAMSVLCREEELIRQDMSLAVCKSSNSARPDTGFLTYTASLSFTIPEEAFHSWSPETPFLYQVRLSFGEDRVQSYFAMRLYSIESPEKTPVFCLNHKPYFLMGVLDQGYWPDGLYTAPSEDALLYDITVMKNLGFNMLRKHIKVESARWYYHCDRLGMIVCQDMVNGGGRYRSSIVSYLPTLSSRFTASFKDSRYELLAMDNPQFRAEWEKECMETIDHLKFFPSIAIWTPFNEGWGQFDAVWITDLIRKKDPSRLIDSASGWFDQGCGDFISVHNYFRPLTVPGKNTLFHASRTVKKAQSGGQNASKAGPPPDRRAAFLSEYGGYACHIKNHSSLERIFGYRRYDSLEEFDAACRELIEKSLLPLQEQGLSGAVYTQLSDVEEEVNGLLTYDRKILKLQKR